MNPDKEMVLLTYQTESVLRDPVPAGKDAVAKPEGPPKTAYIDKLYAFNEVYADEERCDLFFICQDGEIPAHRLVISNASKYIMAMQDDQPPWYPVYISVPDLTKEIVNTLVRLAYTGQMNIPPGTTSDELLDAMQALGWVNTDCLTATYLDSNNTSADEDFGFSPVSSKTTESVETVLRKKFPAASKAETEASDDDDEMEMAVPDVPMSDEEGKLEIDLDSPKKKASPTKRTRQTKVKQPKTPTPSKNKLATPSKRGQSPKQTVETSKKAPEVAPSARKGSRRNNEDAPVTTDAAPKEPELPTTNSVEGDAEPLRSRTRTIRKPKKFDDLIVLTPTKRKESPTKSPSKAPPKALKATNETGKETVEVAKAPSKPPVIKKPSNDVNTISTGSKNRSRRSTSSESKESPRNSLITSYFNKRNPRQGKDKASEGTKDGVKDVTEENNVQSAGSDVEEISSDNNIDTKKQENSTSLTRTRAKSTASSKGEKETPSDDTNPDTDTSPKTRRKRSLQDKDNSVEDSVVEEVNPVKRGRKPSTVSNASKSSNREPVPENDLEENDNAAESPRTRRSRQE